MAYADSAESHDEAGQVRREALARRATGRAKLEGPVLVTMLETQTRLWRQIQTTGVVVSCITASVPQTHSSLMSEFVGSDDSSERQSPETLGSLNLA